MKNIYFIFFLVISLFLITCDSENKNGTFSSGIDDNASSGTSENINEMPQAEKIIIPEIIEAPLIVQQECYYQKPTKEGLEKNKKKGVVGKLKQMIIENGKRYEGKICITFKHFQGYSPYNIPFVATIFGDITELYVDNKKIKFDGEGEIFFRQKIALEHGYNRVSVKAVGKSGDVTEGYVEISVNDIPDKIEVEQK